jgi:enoyl-CoA hydratase
MEPVHVEREGALAILTFDAPPLNLFDAAMIAALQAAVTDVAADPPRGLLVRAEGRVVSGGVDVHLFDGWAAPSGWPRARGVRAPASWS